MKIERGGETIDLAFLNYEFNRILFIFEKGTRNERLVKGNSFIRNPRIHSIQNKREFTLCCVHHNTNTVSCVDVFIIFFLWDIFFAWILVIVRRPRSQC